MTKKSTTFRNEYWLGLTSLTCAMAMNFLITGTAVQAQEETGSDKAAEKTSTETTKKPKAAKEKKKSKSDDAAKGTAEKKAEDVSQMSDPAEPEIKTDKKDGGDKASEKKEEKSLDPSRPFNPAAVRDYNQGVELQQQGFLNQAIQKYKAAIDADDRLEQAFCNIGLIYIAQRNFAKASDAFKKAIVLKPTNPFSLNGMGSVLYSKGKVQEAMEKWQKAIDVDQNFYSAYFNMANAWKNEKDNQKALENYVMTIKTNPSMADAYYEIGVIFAKQKHAAQALCMLNKALALQPDGEFVADAKRQVSALDGMMGKDDSDGEVKMNIVAPAPKEETGSDSNN